MSSGVPTWAPASGGGGGVTSLRGTASQILVGGTTGTPQTGALTLTLPQNIATTSSPQFNQLTISTTGTGTTDAILLTSNSHEQIVKQSSTGSKDLYIQGDAASAGNVGGAVQLNAGSAGTSGLIGGNVNLVGGEGIFAGQKGGFVGIYGGRGNATNGEGGSVTIDGGSGAVKGQVIIGGNRLQTRLIVIGDSVSGTQPTAVYGPVTITGATTINGALTLSGTKLAVTNIAPAATNGYFLTTVAGVPTWAPAVSIYSADLTATQSYTPASSGATILSVTIPNAVANGKQIAVMFTCSAVMVPISGNSAAYSFRLAASNGTYNQRRSVAGIRSEEMTVGVALSTVISGTALFGSDLTISITVVSIQGLNGNMNVGNNEANLTVTVLG
jgi:hypothetical protein